MQIEFIPDSEFAKDFLEPPKPSKTFIPDWYKKMPNLINNEKKYGIAPENDAAVNSTLKGCSPFLDSFTMGYIWSLPIDLEIRKNKVEEKLYEYKFRWRTDGVFVTDHHPQQHPGLPSPYKGLGFVMKWSFEYIIKTPPGYSTFFTHPLNRYDLPFQTLSGVVDTDKYTNAVQFPFQIMDFDEDLIIIEKGTPLCQFFPIKREKWKSEIKEENLKKIKRDHFDFKSKIFKSYKTRFWEKKIYE